MNNEDEYIPLIIPRHTYSQENAERFIKVINKCLENNSNEFISCEDIGLALTSLKQRLNEAFLWLKYNDYTKDNNKYTKQDYNKLRSKIKLTPVTYGGKDGVLLNFFKYKAKTRQPHKKSLAGADSTSLASKKFFDNNSIENKQHWRDRILSFIVEDSQRMLIMDTPEDFNFKPLDELEVEWITKTFTSAGIEFEIDVMSVKAVK